MATIPAPDRFTAFPGWDRTLLLARGELLLAIDGGRPRRLTPGRHVSFPGEAHVVSEPVGPAVALNVMVERGRGTAAVRSLALDGHAPSAAAVVLLTGVAHLHGDQLQAFDAVLGPSTTDVRGAGARVAAISLSEGQP